MKTFLLACWLVMLSPLVFAQNSSVIKEGMVKAEVVKQLGNPTKKLKGDDQKTDCYVWYKKDTAWAVIFSEEKAVGHAATFEDMLKGIMSLRASFSGLADLSGDSNPPEPSAQPKARTDTMSSSIEQAVRNAIQIEVLEAKAINTWSDVRKAGCRLKIKNTSQETIYDLSIVLYYYDKEGKPFFEQTVTPVNSSSWTERIVLKPNYTILYPEEADHYMTADGIDLDEWDEGQVKAEIKKLNIKRPAGE
jgi:hypothetical protein